MKRETKTTRNHDEIRSWAEARCGRPATVKGTEEDGAAGLLRIDFPGYRGMRSLQEITWEEFFEKFDQEGLTFLYQERTATNRPSRFCKFIRQVSDRRSRTRRRQTVGANH